MLSDLKVRAARITGRAYKLTDSGQLYLYVSPRGAKSWRMNYKWSPTPETTVQRTFTIGPYPAITLAMAREIRDRAKTLLATGTEPTRESIFRAGGRATPEPVDLFADIARRWHALHLRRWSRNHAADVMHCLERDVFPAIGAMPIRDLTAPILLDTLSDIANRGAVETAHRARQRISAVFVYAIAAGIVSADPAAGLSVALPPKVPAQSQPALTNLDDLRDMLRACEEERCRPETKLALRFLALTAVRPGELRFARWCEFDISAPEPVWVIPAARMKGEAARKSEQNGDHIVPLAPQSVEILRTMQPLTGDGEWLFQSDRSIHRPISENTLRALLIRAGYYQRHVPHGFRSAFSTIMNERAELAGRASDRAIIDLMLAHIPKDRVERAYNRAAYMPRRRELAREWADLLLADFPAPSSFIGTPMRWLSNAVGRGRN